MKCDRCGKKISESTNEIFKVKKPREEIVTVDDVRNALRRLKGRPIKKESLRWELATLCEKCHSELFRITRQFWDGRT